MKIRIECFEFDKENKLLYTDLETLKLLSSKLKDKLPSVFYVTSPKTNKMIAFSNTTKTDIEYIYLSACKNFNLKIII